MKRILFLLTFVLFTSIYIQAQSIGIVDTKQILQEVPEYNDAQKQLDQIVDGWRKEIEHTMLIGTTGTGKTVALLDLITQARAKGQRVVVFDLTGVFISHFYDPERDVILNPMDARCPQWSIFDECSSISEFHAASEALIPSDGGGNDQFWVLGARSIFMESCMALVRAGTPTNAALAERLMTADLSEVHKLVEGTLAEPMTSPEAAKMAISIRAVLNANAHALMLLPTSGPRFSIRDWVRAKEDIKPGSILFISARYVDLGILSKLLTLWMNIGMHTLMSMTRTDDLRLWFIIDELGALHRLPALEQGLQTARNFAIRGRVQSQSQSCWFSARRRR